MLARPGYRRTAGEGVQRDGKSVFELQPGASGDAGTVAVPGAGRARCAMSMSDDIGRQGDRTLGEAANRWVTWQIVMSVIGLVVFLMFVLLIFLPVFRRVAGGP
jgi:hypothetical protein